MSKLHQSYYLHGCPCGFYGYEEAHDCTCSAVQIRNYQQKLSGPIFDRIDMHLEVPQLSFNQIHQPSANNENKSTQAMKESVDQGLLFRQTRRKWLSQQKRTEKEQLLEESRMSKGAEDLLRLSFESLHFSARGYQKILKLARTIADLNQKEQIEEVEIAEAIHYRSYDRKL